MVKVMSEMRQLTAYAYRNHVEPAGDTAETCCDITKHLMSNSGHCLYFEARSLREVLSP